MKKNTSPPKWAERFLAWYCKPELLEDLQGDLNEYFDRHRSTKGAFRAKIIYVLDVVKFCRWYIVRKPKIIELLTQWIMIRSYIKTSGRNIVRNKLFSFINIAGLAVSLSVGLLMISLLSDLFSYDNFQKNKDRTYRIITHDERSEQPPMDLATTSAKAGKQIGESMAGAEMVTLVRNGFEGDANTGEKVVPVSGLWADEAFLKVFTFPLIQGDKATALKDPYSIVLTEKAAKKLFGDQDALGKSIKLDTAIYTVKGVMKDPPHLSHLRFEALASFSTVEIIESKAGWLQDWSHIYGTYVYVLLPPTANLASFQTNLDQLCKRENAKLNRRTISLSLQPITQIAVGKKLTNQSGPVMNTFAIWILGGLAFIVLLSACLNYTNLSIARSLRRSREVGIRKVMGARRSNVLGQFITESVIIALLSLLVSFVLFLFLRTQFLSLHSFLSDLASLHLSVRTVLWFIALAITVGLMAGFLPALFYSRLNTIQVLKDVSAVQLFRHVNARKMLIVVQYVFSLMFISATTIGYRQYQGFIAFDLGFSTENILNIKLNGNDAGPLLKALSEMPEVNGTSRSVMLTSLGSVWGTTVKYKKSNDSASVWTNVVDEHYLPLHHHKLVAGRNFNPRPASAVESEVLVNEKFLKRFDIGGKDPNHALGEVIIADGTELTIVGVLKDFHYETVEDDIEPTILRNDLQPNSGYVNARIISKDWPETKARLEAVWHKIDPVHPFDAKFYNDEIEQAYSQFAVMLKVIGFLAFLAICIASMGLFGMVVFTTETRLKEISIRKVLGASEWKLIYLLSRGFLILLGMAALVALPATYFFFDNVVLSNFAFHQPIGVLEMILGTVIVLCIALVMMGSQTLKVARTNPATVLKNE